MVHTRCISINLSRVIYLYTKLHKTVKFVAYYLTNPWPMYKCDFFKCFEFLLAIFDNFWLSHLDQT